MNWFPGHEAGSSRRVQCDLPDQKLHTTNILHCFYFRKVFFSVCQAEQNLYVNVKSVPATSGFCLSRAHRSLRCTKPKQINWSKKIIPRLTTSVQHFNTFSLSQAPLSQITHYSPSSIISSISPIELEILAGPLFLLGVSLRVKGNLLSLCIMQSPLFTYSTIPRVVYADAAHWFLFSAHQFTGMLVYNVAS